MSSHEEYQTQCRKYGSKCKEHLRRAELARKLALGQLASQTTFLTDNRQLVEEALGGPRPDHGEVLESVITRTNFLLLKVEFEFFLNRLAYSVWEHHFRDLVERKTVRSLTESYELRGFARAALDGVAKKYVLAKVIPSHGLTRLLAVLKESAGIEWPGPLNKIDRHHWPQIHSAFEVRHLIEHANGKVDEQFKAKAKDDPLWSHSTWGPLDLKIGEKIPVVDRDFETTVTAMIAATDLLVYAVAAL